MSFPAAPTITPRNQVDLTYSSTTITLPAPQFDNVTEINLTRINRETRDKTLKVFSDSLWPEVERFEWTFIGLSLTQRDNLIAFIKLTLGKPITVVDHETRTWTCIIIHPTVPFAQVGPGCQYTAQLQLEVVA